MRRKDREVTNEAYIDKIIMSCDCCRLGLVSGNEAYIVPLNFGYIRENDKQIFYFHSANEGRKLSLIEKNGRVGFELDTNYKLKSGDTACEFSFCFQSVIGTGSVSVINECSEKEAALQQIMQHYSQKSDWKFDSKSLDSVTVIKLVVEEISCKEHV
jgi:nitroimidazol reductase NimA-like FMN-containing flavoprotein (pyridoxamine 5'-phosphate oxidase superfamily)